MRLAAPLSVVTTLLVSACAAVNPNPNVGMRSVDMFYAAGDCQGAMNAALPAARRGEPWAQYRMGALLNDRKCPKASKEQFSESFDWLKKAACFQSNTAWERGNELVVGPTGFFNARASSTRAAIALSNQFAAAGIFGAARFYIERAMRQYEPTESEYFDLKNKMASLESHIAPEKLAAIQKEAVDLCAVPAA
jgi:hypothetical protein